MPIRRLGTDLGGGLRKIRMRIASKGKGKSGGARVITFTVIVAVDETEVNLLYIYDKAERSTVTAVEPGRTAAQERTEIKQPVMALNTDKNLKLYYSIKEVAGMIGVSESMLRFWEKEIPMLEAQNHGQQRAPIH